MKRSIAGVLVAVVLAALGTFVLVSYVRGADERAMAGERVVPVLVATGDIEQGTVAGALTGQVTVRRIPAKVRADGAVASLDALKGRVASVDLVPGEQILDQRFVAPEELAARSRVPVPQGFQQVTVSLSPAQALGGLLRPGDTVGVAASFGDIAGAPATHLVLHKILVTNIQGPQTATQGPPAGATTRENAPADGFLVTLAVDAISAERVIFAAEHGSVWLTLQPDDVRTDGAQVTTIEKVYQ